MALSFPYKRIINGLYSWTLGVLCLLQVGLEVWLWLVLPPNNLRNNSRPSFVLHICLSFLRLTLRQGLEHSSFSSQVILNTEASGSRSSSPLEKQLGRQTPGIKGNELQWK